MSVGKANGLQTPVLGHGNVQFLSNNKKVTLHFLYVPDLAETLISMGKLWELGFTIHRTQDHLFSIKMGNSTLMNRKLSNNLFILKMQLFFLKSEVASISKSPEFLHKRVGNPVNDILQRIHPNIRNIGFCQACSLRNSKQLPYKGTLAWGEAPGHKIHSDLSGRISPPSIGGGNYYLKLMDD
ncbi:hypothetical protein O181_101119 [Austropuccinia psidii MF-1]|uniref:Uncharacterized protein n=1 Tax=Austropuccinia psidii MF-1 TaxID=1389203 RepID=A0A9Q3JFY3_9BASI|nr:hypothetical protein [Austropuccinia psidii MF-1]